MREKEREGSTKGNGGLVYKMPQIPTISNVKVAKEWHIILNILSFSGLRVKISIIKNCG